MQKISSPQVNILEEKNIVADDFLDIIGNEFKFDHEKGLSELLKNSVDAYIRNNISDKDQNVFFRFTDGDKDDATLECIDFVGMDENDIVKAFKIWFDPQASKRGLNKKTYGGHGNGGKFYMRQMFEKSHFLTYKNGLLNIFGFNEKKKYGFAQGFKSKKISVEEAFKIANIESLSSAVQGKKEVGFTVVKGIGPVGMKNKIKVERIVERIKNHPQSRNIIARINLGIIYNNKTVVEQLKPIEIKSMKGFEVPFVISIPEKIILVEEGEEQEVLLSNNRPTA